MGTLVLSLFVFWFLTVFVTQDHKIDLLTGAVWSFVALASASIVVHLLRIAHIFEQDTLVLLAIAAAVQGLILGYALRFRFYISQGRQIATILGLYYAVFLVLGFVAG